MKNGYRQLAAAMLALLLVTVTVTVWLSSSKEPSSAQPDNIVESRAEILSVTRMDQDTEDTEAVDWKQASDVITEGGAYRLTGEQQGTLTIDAEEQIVHLILNNYHIRSSEGPAILIRSAGKVIITLVAGTENSVQDYAVYDESEEPNAALFSNADLTINGEGSLSVTGTYKDAIHSKDTVRIMGGQISLTSRRDGIRGNDGVLICDGDLTIQSVNDGIVTTRTGKEPKGTIEICGGELHMIAGGYAFRSVKDLSIHDCSIDDNAVFGFSKVDGTESIQEGCRIDE